MPCLKASILTFTVFAHNITTLKPSAEDSGGGPHIDIIGLYDGNFQLTSSTKTM